MPSVYAYMMHQLVVRGCRGKMNTVTILQRLSIEFTCIAGKPLQEDKVPVRDHDAKLGSAASRCCGPAINV